MYDFEETEGRYPTFFQNPYLQRFLSMYLCTVVYDMTDNYLLLTLFVLDVIYIDICRMKNRTK